MSRKMTGIIAIIVKWAALLLFGLAAGLITATGLFALISSVGLINRFADVSNTCNKLMLYEEMIILGAVLGNIVYIFDAEIYLGMAGCLIYGLIAGIFIGCFLICLAETMKSLPIFIRRVRISDGLGFIILAVAAGKAFGHLLYYLKLY